jgi:hypothetical protein
VLGQVTRTSSTSIYDRVIRVGRRLRNRDHVGGTYATYDTIIERYHVRLFPDTHRRRERQEVGEILSEPQAFRAYADPTHNGKSIMIGDRFFDDKNRQCYDVVGAWRPRGQSSYSQMLHFELRIVEDCPELRAAPQYPEVVVVDGGSGGADGPTQTHFIMRHFGHSEIDGWESLPYFDGMVYNLQTDDLPRIATLADAIASGKQWWRYYNIQSYPFNGTEFGGLTPPLATWFNWLRDNIQFLGTASHRRMRVGNLVSLSPGFASPLGQQHEVIPWGVVSTAERQAAVDQMVALANAPGGVALPVSGIFLDQSWLIVETFQISTNPLSQSGHGDTKESSPGLFNLNFAGAEAAFGDGGPWTTHTAAMIALYDEAAAALSPTGKYALKNGEHGAQNGATIPKPWYFENAWNNNVDGPNQPERWANAKAGFATDPRNVLSILCSAAPNETVGVPEALDHWEATGGWIAFTSQDDPGQPGAINAEAAYAQAAQRLALMGFPS